MDMQVEEITQILRESPSVRLIKSRSVDFFLSFVIEAFEGQSAIMQERLHMLLENRLDEQENALVEDNKLNFPLLRAIYLKLLNRHNKQLSPHSSNRTKSNIQITALNLFYSGETGLLEFVLPY